MPRRMPDGRSRNELLHRIEVLEKTIEELEARLMELEFPTDATLEAEADEWARENREMFLEDL